MLKKTKTSNKNSRGRESKEEFLEGVKTSKKLPVSEDESAGELSPSEAKSEVYRQEAQSAAKAREKILIELKKEIKPTLKNLREEIDKTRQKLEKDKLRLIETLALFVALFTFISVDIQVFKLPLSLRSASGFVLIMLGSLTLFLLVLHYMLLNLSFKKIITHRGSMGSFIQSVRMFDDWEEKKELKFRDPSTWGEGFKVFLLLFLCSVTMIGFGVYLVSRNTAFEKVRDAGEELNKMIDIEIKDNKIRIPDNINIYNKKEGEEE